MWRDNDMFVDDGAPFYKRSTAYSADHLMSPIERTQVK